jgi:hypothetical protein
MVKIFRNNSLFLCDFITGLCRCFKCTCGNCKCSFREAKLTIRNPGLTSGYKEDYPEKKNQFATNKIMITNEPFTGSSSGQFPGFTYESTTKV